MKAPEALQTEFAFLTILLKLGNGCAAKEFKTNVTRYSPLRHSTFDITQTAERLLNKDYIKTTQKKLFITQAGTIFFKSVCDALEFSADLFDLVTVTGCEQATKLSLELSPKEYASASRQMRHHVYVALLATASHKTTPTSIYVGMTGLDPNERFRNHKQGYKAGRKVKKYGICLLPELFLHLNPMTYDQAVKMEVELAQRLNKIGYEVYGGH